MDNSKYYVIVDIRTLEFMRDGYGESRISDTLSRALSTCSTSRVPAIAAHDCVLRKIFPSFVSMTRIPKVTVRSTCPAEAVK